MGDSKQHRTQPSLPEWAQPAREEPAELQPYGNAAAASALAGAGSGATPETGSEPNRHTLFVDGTWHAGQDDYWDPGMMEASNALTGSDSSERFSWYGGPNDPLARSMAGRSLYQEGVLPALERGDELNLVAHSHGGNVIGEMGAYADQRRGHVDLMSRAADAEGVAGIGTKLAAGASLTAQLAGLGMEALHLAEHGVEQHGGADHRAVNLATGMNAGQRETAVSEMRAQLGEEAMALLGDGAAVLGGDSERFASEKEALEGADLGQAIFLNVPWQEQHDHPLDSELLGTLDRVDAFQTPGDRVVGGAQRISGDRGRRITTDREPDADGPQVFEQEWTRTATGLDRVDPRFNHSAPLGGAEAFNEEIGNAIDPERYASEEEVRAEREAAEGDDGGGMLNGLFGD